MSGLGSLISLTTLPQKLMLGGVGVTLVAAIGCNAVQMIENRNLSHDKEALTLRIEDPATGYIVRLNQVKSNVVVCKAAVERQTTALKAQGQRDAATIATVQHRYDVEHVARGKAESAAAVILAHKPAGNTEAERMADVDKQILGDLK